MAWSRGFLRFAGRGGSAALLAAVGAVLLGGSSAQDSCVQVSNTSFVPACPCDAGSTLAFGIEGQTTVTANTVNVAIVLDGSGSIFPDDFILSKDFAKNTVAAFADQNLFDNGGTASFTQFSSSATLGGTFSSQEDFDAFLDAEAQLSGFTNIPAGIARGSELLAAAPNTSTSFMVVLTDGVGGDPTLQADAARAAGTIVYAVGVGTGPDNDTLVAIAGDVSNIFDVDDFTELDTALEGIVSSSEGSVPCAATGAIISLVFDAVVAEASVGDGSGTSTISADGSTVVFELSGTLEATPTDFSVVLEVCEGAPGDEVVSAVTYTDDEGNVPDLSALEGDWATVPTCDSGFTPAPASPTVMPLGVPLPTPVPTFVETPVVGPTDFSFDYSYEYSYDYGYDSWFDDDDATFSYPGGSGSDVPTPSPVQQPVGPAPHHMPHVPPTAHPVTAPVDGGSDGGSDGDGDDDSSVSEDGDPTCDNGFDGIQSGTVCCEAGCGSCGGVGCSGRPGGADACCVTEIRLDGEECSVAGAAPCYIDDYGDDGSASADDDDDEEEEEEEEEDDDSASYSYDFYPSSWEDDPASDGGMGWCSNGIPGIASTDGNVCCALGCGQCGGVGCSRFGAPELDSYDCCTTVILSYGESCSATGEAPCYLNA